jgi:hypothetical protein
MYKTQFIFCLFLAIALGGYGNGEQKLRVKKLGNDICDFASQGNYKAEHPKDLVFIGANTFWKVLEVCLSNDSTRITVHEGNFSEHEYDYLIDYGTSLALKIRYDPRIDKFHIVGFLGAQASFEDNRKENLIRLNQELYKDELIYPAHGLNGITVKKTMRKELFKKFSENEFNRSGLYFNFLNDTLNKLYISKYQLKTKEGIRPETSSTQEIIKAYGEPKSIKTEINFLGQKIKSVKLYEYDGVSFLLLKDTVMLVIVE